MITHNGTYLLHATHHGMPIVAATMGGKMVFGGKWLPSATLQAIVAAFGAEGTEVIAKTNDYLNRIATTDPQRALLLAGFINEDPMLVCSLVETSKTRWLDNGGTYAYIDTGLTTDKNCQYMKASVKVQFFKTSGTYYMLANSTLNFNRNNQNIATGTIGNIYTFSTGEPLDIYVLASPSTSKKGFGVNGVEKISTFDNPMPSAYKIFLFALGTDTLYSQTAERVTFAHAKIEKDGVMLREMYPFIRNGVNGMLDIISGTFYPNANTEGSFTIALTPKTTS